MHGWISSLGLVTRSGFGLSHLNSYKRKSLHPRRGSSQSSRTVYSKQVSIASQKYKSISNNTVNSLCIPRIQPLIFKRVTPHDDIEKYSDRSPFVTRKIRDLLERIEVQDSNALDHLLENQVSDGLFGLSPYSKSYGEFLLLAFANPRISSAKKLALLAFSNKPASRSLSVEILEKLVSISLRSNEISLSLRCFGILLEKVHEISTKLFNDILYVLCTKAENHHISQGIEYIEALRLRYCINFDLNTYSYTIALYMYMGYHQKAKSMLIDTINNIRTILEETKTDSNDLLLLNKDSIRLAKIKLLNVYITVAVDRFYHSHIIEDAITAILCDDRSEFGPFPTSGKIAEKLEETFRIAVILHSRKRNTTGIIKCFKLCFIFGVRLSPNAMKALMNVFGFHSRGIKCACNALNKLINQIKCTENHPKQYLDHNYIINLQKEGYTHYEISRILCREYNSIIKLVLEALD